MIIQNILIGILVLVGILLLIKTKKPKAVAIPAPKHSILTYNDAFFILNTIINEIIENRKFALTINNKITVPPIDEEIVYMVNEVFSSISGSLLIDLERYVTKDFIIRYLTRVMREYCEDYILSVRKS